MRSQKHSPGVAWKEVLAVAAIILFVMYALFPSHPHSRKNARRSTCQANMKQIGLAYVQYTQDSDDAFPPGRAPGGAGWAGQLYPYVKAAGIYHCPEDTRSDPHISYAENLRLLHRKWADIAAPARTVQTYEDETPGCDPSQPEAVSGTGLSAPQSSPRHDEKGFSLNFLVVDGHVKYLKPGQVSSGVNAVRPKATHDGSPVMTFAVK